MRVHAKTRAAKTLLCALAIAFLLSLAACHKSQSRPIIGGDPNVVGFKDDDPEMNAAIAKAVQNLPEFVACVEKPSPTQSTVSLKVRFEDPNGVEHMWLTNVTHNNGNFSGVLDDDPVVVKNVRAGESVTVSKDRVSDWLVIDNGQMKGGYSIQLMMREMSPEEQAALKSAMGIR